MDLEAQRALQRLRREAGVKTQLIVASVREWQTFFRVAGCDVFTAPCDVLGKFLSQTDMPVEALTSQLDTSYDDRHERTQGEACKLELARQDGPLNRS